MPLDSFMFLIFVGNEVSQHESPTAAAVVATLMRVDRSDFLAATEELSAPRVEIELARADHQRCRAARVSARSSAFANACFSRGP